MFSIRRTVIGVVAAFAIGVFAVAMPVAGSSASADGGTKSSVIESVATKYTMAANTKINPDLLNPDLLNPDIRCEDPGCLGIVDDDGIYGIRCEDQDCLRPVGKVAVPDGGTIVMGGIRCEDQDCF